MVKVYVALGLVCVTFGGGFIAGCKINEAKHLKRQAVVRDKAIVDSNQDSEALRSVRTEITNESRKVEREIIQLPPIIIDNTTPCPTDNTLVDIIGLQHNVNKTITKVRIQ